MKLRYYSICYFGRIHEKLPMANLFVIIFLAGCSPLNIESAKSLDIVGTAASAQNAENIFVSDDEYQQAMDAEAFFHGFAGAEVPQTLFDNYEKIQAELSARKIVFTKLGGVYESFSSLAAVDVATGAETAINGLGDAINGYASALNKNPVISNVKQDVFSRVGGLVAAEIQKKKIGESSKLIRERLIEFVKLFEDPLVRVQMITFKQSILQNRTAAIQLMWEKGVFNPNRLIDQMGSNAGLEASKEAIKIINDPNDTTVKDGLSKVIVSRLNRKINLIERGYDASVNAVNELALKHKKLENGEEMSLVRLRQIITELQRITDLLTPSESSS